MNIFDQYGIKEVADVTLYSIHKKTDGSGDIYYVPALYLDTLKVSTVEKTAESTWAEGGLGNARLINWDYGKQINVTLEDALCTPASLGLCWNGILSADWKDAKVDYNTDVCYCRKPLTRLARMEKAQFPRQDTVGGIVSNLLPKVSNDKVDDGLGILKISSIVDGTDIHGMGMVKNHTYKWKMAIESAVKSIAVVPDRFFDVKGKSYSIDWNRKVSVDSLPDYENYKDAIIYRINTRSDNVVPPVATIIFDNEMQNRRGTVVDKTFKIVLEENDEPGTYSLGEILTKGFITDYHLYDGGYFAKEEPQADDTFFPVFGFDQTFSIKNEDEIELKVFSLNSYGIHKYLPNTHRQVKVYNVGSTLVNYLQNHATTDLIWDPKLQDYIDGENEKGNDEYNTDNGNVKAIIDVNGSVERATTTLPIREGDYLAIIVDNNNDYHALIGQNQTRSGTEDGFNGPSDVVVWFAPETKVDTSQFEGIDMWLRFESINEMIYFMITKYEQDIFTIKAATIHPYADNSTIDKDEAENGWDVNRNSTLKTTNDNLEAKKTEGKLWAYINPRTMQPFPDDYWFHQGDPYYVRSLTIAPEGKHIKGNQIVVKADQWPGMYMMVGETYIRNRDTGEDERMQIKFPQCKVKSDQTLTLSADGEPTTFNLDLEVARPRTGHMMEITTYEVATKMVEGENGCFYAVDGSSEVLSE